MQTINKKQAGQFILAKQGLIPILFGDRFVGRIEVIPDRKEHILNVKGLWWEPGVRVTKKLNDALDRTLREFGKFNDL